MGRKRASAGCVACLESGRKPEEHYAVSGSCRDYLAQRAWNRTMARIFAQDPAVPAPIPRPSPAPMTPGGRAMFAAFAGDGREGRLFRQAVARAEQGPDYAAALLAGPRGRVPGLGGDVTKRAARRRAA